MKWQIPRLTRFTLIACAVLRFLFLDAFILAIFEVTSCDSVWRIIKRNFVSEPRDERCLSSNKSSQKRKAQSNRLCIRGTVRSENPMPSRWNDPKMPKGEFRTQTRLQLLSGNQSVLGGISPVVRCSPLNCKFGCLIHGHWVKCHSAPWASAFTSNAQEEANSRLQPEIRHQESGFRHQ